MPAEEEAEVEVEDEEDEQVLHESSFMLWTSSIGSSSIRRRSKSFSFSEYLIIKLFPLQKNSFRIFNLL